jgi:hypothetical protein
MQNQGSMDMRGLVGIGVDILKDAGVVDAAKKWIGGLFTSPYGA